MKISHFLFTLLFISQFSVAASSSSSQDKKDIDPSDVTRVITGLKFLPGVNGHDGDLALEAELQFAGSFNQDNQFLSMINIQAAENSHFEPQSDFSVREIRGRWFQVFNTGNERITRAGYSLDFVSRSSDDANPIDNIVAVGGVVKAPITERWNLYPNVALVGAFAKDDYQVPGSSDGKGLQLNLFNSINLSKYGAYLMINPQYSYIDFGNYVSKDLLMEFKLGYPLTSNKRLWLLAVYHEHFTGVDSDTSLVTRSNMKTDDDARRFRLGVSYFF